MNCLKNAFETAKTDRNGALIIYLTAGYPTMEESEDLFVAAAEAGADILEVGFPYSDPIADGPVIQRACQDALEAGASMRRILEMVPRIADRTPTPLVLMTCFNPILAYGIEEFAADAADAGMTGVLIADMPPSESAMWSETAQEADLETVFLAAPTTPEERLQEIVDRTTGFIYVISSRGVTGERDALPPELPQRVKTIQLMTDVPVAVGFGISSSDQVRQVCDVADGAIVGSAVVSAALEADSAQNRLRAVSDAVSMLAGGCR
ncbi:MAG: tryptophan synthase subunit alpha [Armatimonadota bacterium]